MADKINRETLRYLASKMSNLSNYGRSILDQSDIKMVPQKHLQYLLENPPFTVAGVTRTETGFRPKVFLPQSPVTARLNTADLRRLAGKEAYFPAQDVLGHELGHAADFLRARLKTPEVDERFNPDSSKEIYAERLRSLIEKDNNKNNIRSIVSGPRSKKQSPIEKILSKGF